VCDGRGTRAHGTPTSGRHVRRMRGAALAPTLAGTWPLIRLAARRDRVVLPVWLAALVGLLLGTAVAMDRLYTTEADRLVYAALSANTVMARAFDGPIMGTSLGGVTIVEVYAVLAVLIGVMSVQTVVRHTRADEEAGRVELVGSAVVGRHAPLTAALSVAFAANVLLGVAAAVALSAYDLPPIGALAAGAAMAGVGTTFSAAGAVAAQVSSSPRGANGLGMTMIGTAFLLRAVGDALGSVAPSGTTVESAWPSWLSPIGWGHQLRAFEGERWQVLGLHATLTVVLVGVAFLLRSRRDVGAGLVQVSPGPPRGSPLLCTPLGLAWHLQRWMIVAWLAGLLVVSGAFGSIAERAEELLATSEELATLIAAAGAGGIVDLFFSFFMGLLAVTVGGFTVQSVLRARNEEAAGRAEPLLATAVGRTRWFASHITIAAGGSAAMLSLAALGGGMAHLGVSGQNKIGVLLQAAVVNLPAVLVLGGFVVAVVGLTPRWAAPIGWAALVASLVVGQFGALFELPQMVLNLSPFTHTPAVPAQELTWAPVLGLIGVAAALTALGLAAFHRRDLAA
jgi:ABC-2 type transport system permease protein